MSNIFSLSLKSAMQDMQTQSAADTSEAIALEIGAPVYEPRSMHLGYVAGFKFPEYSMSVISGGGMRSITRYAIVVMPDDETGDNWHERDVPDFDAIAWNAKALAMGGQFAEPALNAPELLATARRQREEARAARHAADEAAAQERARYETEIASKIPAWAKAVILGVEDIDDCDSMSDYFNVKTGKIVILGFSRHTRDLFPEMRKAALNYHETAHLADAPDSAEHREKYSMGSGYYLKTGGSYSSGWKVHKRAFYGKGTPASQVPTGEWFTAEPAAAPSPSQKAGDISEPMAAGCWTISQHIHTKKGFDMWICSRPDRVERSTYDALLDKARGLGGWYSRPWGNTPGGFAFKSEAAALAFTGGEPSTPEHGPDISEPTEARAAPRPAPISEPMGDKLRALADSMQPEIERRYADRLTNTPKRQREAGEARNDGRRWERARDGLRALAGLHDAGTVPPALAGMRTKKAAYELARSAMDHSGGYYSPGVDLNKPASQTPEALAFWELLKPNPEREKAEALRRKVDAVKLSNIPGYFPTPPEVIARMIDHAGNLDGLDVIEPSAGDGAILDAIRADFPGAKLMACERQFSLREILQLKGYEVAGDDCTQWQPPHLVDRVMMNPPFENGQDAAHVRLAHSWLRSGGRLVAIMSPGPFFRSNAKSAAFREWFDAMGGEKYDLPANSFKASGTGVAAVLVVIDKE